MKIYLLLIPMLLFALPLEKFHICTVASTRNYPTFFYLEHSISRMGIDLEILGLERPYLGNGTKFLYMSEYLDSLPDDDIVLFIDAYDVMIVRSKAELLKKFLAFNSPLVISAEKSCILCPELASTFDETKPFPYLNSGGYIGYVGNLKEWLEELNINPTQRDQPQLIRHYAKNSKRYCLDTKAELFLSLYLLEPSDIEFGLDGFCCKETGTYPGVIHANGRSFSLLVPIYKRFMKNPTFN